MPSVEQPDPRVKGESSRGENQMAKEFPGFPPLEGEVRALLEEYGFTEDLSWHNDACPSFATKDSRWILWINHPDVSERELSKALRFILQPNLSEGALGEDVRDVFAVETIGELSDALSGWKDAFANAEVGSVHAAGRALEAHSKALGIEGDSETQVWQLIASLQEYCAVNGIDFDSQLSDVKDQIRRGDVGLPAAAEKLRAVSQPAPRN